VLGPGAGNRPVRFQVRIDGAPLWHSALTPENGSTISPFISLSAAST
jgi:hypothetical protein